MEKPPKEPIRRRKVIPNVRQNRKNSTGSDLLDKVPNQPTDNLKKSGTTKKDTQVYVLSPDLVKKFGISIPTPTNKHSNDKAAEKFKREYVPKRKTDISSIKQSLQNKLLAKVNKTDKITVESLSSSTSHITSPKFDLRMASNNYLTNTPIKVNRYTKDVNLFQESVDKFQYSTRDLTANAIDKGSTNCLNTIKPNVPLSSNTETAKIISSTLLLSSSNSSTFENTYSSICNNYSQMTSSKNHLPSDYTEKNNSLLSSPSKNNIENLIFKESDSIQDERSIYDSDNSVISDILPEGISHMEIDSENAIGIDEIQIEATKNQQILTLDHNIDSGESIQISRLSDVELNVSSKKELCNKNREIENSTTNENNLMKNMSDLEQKSNTIMEYLKQFLRKSTETKSKPENIKYYTNKSKRHIDTEKPGVEKPGGKFLLNKVSQYDPIKSNNSVNQKTLEHCLNKKSKNVTICSSNFHITQSSNNINIEVETNKIKFCEVPNICTVNDNSVANMEDSEILNENQFCSNINTNKHENQVGDGYESSIDASKENSQAFDSSINRNTMVNNENKHLEILDNVVENVDIVVLNNFDKDKSLDNFDNSTVEMKINNENEVCNNATEYESGCLVEIIDFTKNQVGPSNIAQENFKTIINYEKSINEEHNYSQDFETFSKTNREEYCPSLTSGESTQSNLFPDNISRKPTEVKQINNNDVKITCDDGLLAELQQIEIEEIMPKKVGRPKKSLSIQKSQEQPESNIISNKITVNKKMPKHREPETSIAIVQSNTSELNQLHDALTVDFPNEKGNILKTKNKPKLIDKSNYSDHGTSENNEKHNLILKTSKKIKEDESNQLNVNIENDESNDRKRNNPAMNNSLKTQNKTSSKISCGVCQTLISKSKWRSHILDFHNGLAWAEEETPLNMSDERLVFSILQAKLKSGKSLKCEKCSTTRRSALGFISHIKICQKSEDEILSLKEECPVCKRKIFPQCLRSHILTHKEPKPIELNSDDLEVRSTSEDLILDRKVKRKAAKIAEETFKKLKISSEDIDSSEKNAIAKKFYEKITKPKITTKIKSEWKIQLDAGLPLLCPYDGCNHTEKNENDISKHYLNKCDKKPLYICFFVCSLCDATAKANNEMIKHVLDNHSDAVLKQANNNLKTEMPSEDSSSDDQSDEIIVKSKKNINRSKAQSQIHCDFICAQNALIDNCKFHANYGEKFVLKNYSSTPLFINLPINNYKPLSLLESMSFLPESKTSCKIGHTLYTGTKFNHSKVEVEWKQYELFESDIHNGSLTLWCGGPVWSIAWVPGKHDVQYLAVAADRVMNGRYAVLQNYSHKNIIQIWNVGHLSNEIGRCKTPASMIYAIAHDYGIVWDMEFCPSGCDNDSDYDSSMNDTPIRMGMLAVACSNGSCYLYAIYHPLTLPTCESKIFHTKPSIELLLNERTSCNVDNALTQAVKISWSKLQNHSIIAVGYSNGMVALFDLLTKSSLLISSSNSKDTAVLLPYHSFQPYMAPINGLEIMPFDDPSNNEKNIISLGISSVIGCGIWNNDLPIVNKTGRYTNMTVTYPWPQIVVIADEMNLSCTSKLLGNGAPAVIPRFSTNCDIRLLPSGTLYGGGVCDTNMWFNGLFVGNRTGDIFVCPIMSTLISKHRHLKKKDRRKAVLSMAQYVNLNKDAVIENKRTFETLEKAIEITKSSEYNFIPESTTYNETCDKYGLLFMDVPYEAKKQFNFSTYKSKPYQSDLWHLHSVLSLRSNPSRDAYLFQAFGGRAGHVRIMCASHLYKQKHPIKINKEAFF